MTTQRAIYEKPNRIKFAQEVLAMIKTGEGTLADCYYRANYKAKTRAVAKANACRLKKHPEVQQHLSDFKTTLEEFIPPEVAAFRLAKIIASEDHRAALGGIQERNRVLDEYPAGKLKVQAYNEELERLEAK